MTDKLDENGRYKYDIERVRLAAQLAPVRAMSSSMASEWTAESTTQQRTDRRQERVLKKEPGKPLKLVYIENELKVLQEAVGGDTETAPFGDAVVICNDEGRLKGT